MAKTPAHSTYQGNPPIDRKSVESGLITESAVSENRRPETSVTESMNFHFDTIGAATLRAGTTKLGSTLSGAVTGMHYFVDTVNAISNTQLIVVAGGIASYLSGGSFVSKRTGLTAASKARFSTYLNYAFMVNGTEATAVWDGNPASSFSTAGNALNAPIGTIIENYRSRMWIGGDPNYPSRAYFSSIPSSVTTPVITWNISVTTGQWIDISPSDGDSLTAFQRSRTAMLAFKTNHLYRIFDIGQVDPDPYANVGTSSQESVIETKSGIAFHHSSGFYMYNLYGLVQDISQPIIDIVRAIPSSAYSSITGWLEPNGNHVCWALGNVTYKGVTYTNMVVRYTLSSQVWTHYGYPTQFKASLRRQPLYNDGSSLFVLTGDTAGNVFEMDTGITDNGQPIIYSLVHRWDNIDHLMATRTTAMTGLFNHYGGATSVVNYQIEDDEPNDLNDWTKTVGTLKTINTGFNTMNIKSRKFRFRVSGVSRGQPFVYHGYEIIFSNSEFINFT